jgi:acyl dehydratase
MKDAAAEPPEHRYPDRRGFEDLAVGDTFHIPSRTMTEALFAAFQTASADNHPIHYDREYCRRHGHRDLLAHGFQVLIQTAAGAGTFAHVIGDALIAFLDQSSRFVSPVYAGDTLYCSLTVTALDRQRTTGVVTVRSTAHNQRGELCLEGTQRYLLRLASPAAPSAGTPAAKVGSRSSARRAAKRPKRRATPSTRRSKGRV